MCIYGRDVCIVFKLCTLRLPAFGRHGFGRPTGQHNCAWARSGLTGGVSHGNTEYHVFPLPDVSDPKFASIS